MSYEHALDVYREKIADHEAWTRENQTRVSSEWIKATEAIGLSMSDWYKQQVELLKAIAKAEKITQLRKQLAELEASA